MNSLVMNPKECHFIVSGVRTEPGTPDACAFQVGWQINPHMKIGGTSIAKAECEHESFIATLEDCGAVVDQVPFVPGAYDSVFMKDNAVIFSDEQGTRALLTAPATKERAGEPLARAFYLRALGISVSGQCRERLEGGDVVLNSNRRVGFLGYGFRSAKEASVSVSRFVKFPIIPLELVDPYFYHLDTAMNLIIAGDRLVAFAHREAFTAQGWQELCSHPAIDIVIPVDREEAMLFALNWVEVNDVVIFGAPVPRTQARLKQLGKRTLVSPLSQFQMAGGSAACLVAPVYTQQTSRQENSEDQNDWPRLSRA